MSYLEQHTLGLPHAQTRVMGHLGYTNQEGAARPSWGDTIQVLGQRLAQR